MSSFTLTFPVLFIMAGTTLIPFIRTISSTKPIIFRITPISPNMSNMNRLLTVRTAMPPNKSSYWSLSKNTFITFIFLPISIIMFVLLYFIFLYPYSMSLFCIILWIDNSIKPIKKLPPCKAVTSP